MCDELAARGHINTIDIAMPVAQVRQGAPRVRAKFGSHRIGGAQLARITFLAPTSLAICIISFDVVPLTIESTPKVSDAANERKERSPTIYNKDIFA